MRNEQERRMNDRSSFLVLPPSFLSHPSSLFFCGIAQIEIAGDLFPFIAEQLGEAVQLRLPLFAARAISGPTIFHLALRLDACALKLPHGAFKTTTPALRLFRRGFMPDACAAFEIQILGQFVEHVPRAGFERAHLWVIRQFTIRIFVEAGTYDGAGFEREKQDARKTLMHLHRMQEVYQRML